MKAVSIVTVILNCLVLLLSSIGSLNNYLRGITPPSQPANMFMVIVLFLFLALNGVTLFYLFKKTDEKSAPKMNEGTMKKIFIGLGWFMLILLAAQFIAGVIIGAIAGVSATPSSAGEAGRMAAKDFFQQYGGLFFLGSALAAIVGTRTGWLPFTKDEEK